MLNDITNTVLETPPTSSSKSRLTSSSRPKVFRQTSLFAFTAARLPVDDLSSSSCVPSPTKFLHSDEGYDSFYSDPVEGDEVENESHVSSCKRLRLDQATDLYTELHGSVKSAQTTRRARLLSRNMGEQPISLDRLTFSREYSSVSSGKEYLNRVSGTQDPVASPHHSTLN